MKHDDSSKKYSLTASEQYWLQTGENLGSKLAGIPAKCLQLKSFLQHKLSGKIAVDTAEEKKILRSG